MTKKLIVYNINKDLIILKNEDGNKILGPCFLGHHLVIKDESSNIVVEGDNKNIVVRKNRTKR